MKILYISENPEDTEHLLRLFKAHFPKVQVVVVKDEKASIDALTIDGPFGVLMIDVTLRLSDPSLLAEKLTDLSGSRPIVFFGPRSFVESRVKDVIYQSHDANQLLYRPYDGLEFKQKLEIAIKWTKTEDFEQSVLEVNREDFLPIKIKNFYLYDSIPYEAFLDIGNEKFVKVLAKNKKYTQAFLRQYVQKDVKNFYLYKDETIRFLESAILMINEKIERVLTLSTLTDYHDSNFNHKALIDLQIGGARLLQQVIKTIGVLDSVKRLTNNLIATSMHLFDRTKDLTRILAAFPYKDKDLAVHAILTNYMCLEIIESIGWDSKTTRDKLGLASIIHDTFISNDKMAAIYVLDDPALKDFTEEEQEEFKNHPIKGANLVNYYSGYSDVDFIISQHHENPHGKGFPNHVSSLKVTTFAAVFILANRFACLFLSPWRGISVHKIMKNAIKKLVVDFNVGNYKDPLKALEKCVEKIF
ncbi:MAG: hypothetical protein HQK49_18050 [Oligoflexia bacterium]|nr:hypothetical protein [Oligoflexia bacterium]